jgi:uncharacterized membrane protein
MRFADPVKKSRLVGVDAARGIALIGLMIIHILPGSNDDDEPTVLWSVFAGHSAALFAVLAGVSLALSSGSQDPLKGTALKAARASVAVRAGLITALGLIIAYVDTPASIILAYYGVMFFLAIVVLGLSARALAFLAAGVAVVGPITVQALREFMPEPGFDPTFTTLFTEPGVLVSQLLFTGEYPALPYMTYICAGLAIGRLDLGSRLVQFRVMSAGVVLAVTTWLLSAVLLGPFGAMSRLQDSSPGLSTETIDEMLIWGPEDYLPTTSLWWQAIVAPYSTSVLEMLNTTGTSMAVLGAVLLLARVAAGALTPLAALGSMTLTLYSAHLLVLATGFLEDQPNASLITQIVIATIFAFLWRRTRDHGPLEGLVATATKHTRTRLSGPV